MKSVFKFKRMVFCCVLSVVFSIFLALPVNSNEQHNLSEQKDICQTAACHEEQSFPTEFQAYSSNIVGFSNLNLFTSTPPIVSSISPANPPVSNTEQIITVSGSNFAEGLTVIVTLPNGSTNTIPGENVTPTSFSIRVVINTPGKFCLRIINPNAEQTSNFCFSVINGASPNVTSISPANPTPNTTEIAVSGGNFVSGLTVTLFFPGGGSGTLSGSQIQNVTSTTFVMRVQLGFGSWCFRVNTPNGGQSNSFCFTVNNATTPIISSISPASPTVSDNNQTIDVFGGNFQMGLTVTVFFPNGGSATLSGTQINLIDATHTKIIVTFNIIGTYGIRINNPNGEQSNIFNFTTQAAVPVITSISPMSPCERNVDQPVTVSGSNFRVGLTVTVTFPNGGTATLSGSQIQSVTNNSFTMIITLADGGDYTIRVNNPGETQSNNFVVLTQNCVSIASLNPQSPIRSNVDQDVVVLGSNFVAGLTVTITFPNGGTATLSGSQILNVTPTTFTMRITVNGIGTWAIKVRNPNGDLSKTVSFVVKNKGVYDFDGDGKTDLSIFRPNTGEWWYIKSTTGGNAVAQFGNSEDKLAPGDFTGDGKTDIAFFRPSTGEWFILRSEDFSYYSFSFGAAGDVPAPADYDGDGKSDQAVFRPSSAIWYIRRSSDGGTTIQQFGSLGDAPVVADYDGDGKADISTWRSSAGQWWIQRSSLGTIAFSFGNSTDKPVQGDYTGDGKADVALFRNGEWFVLRSENQSYYSFPFGTNGDTPAPGDYDGDGKSDGAVFRPSTSTWYAQRAIAGTLIQSFGQNGDKPIPSAYVP